MTLEEEVVALRAENQALREQLAAALARLEELTGKREAPSFVKANTPKPAGARPPRRQRRKEQNGARRREAPTQYVRHALPACPDCGYALHGGQVVQRRQVVDLPPPVSVLVTEHQVVARWCPACARWQRPRRVAAGLVLGQGRLGVRLASLVAYLRSSLRLPLRQIQQYLLRVHQLRVSVGGIQDLLRRIHQVAQPALGRLKAQAQRSRWVHADETGWREDGQNGYIWALARGGARPVRYFEYHRSRAGTVLDGLLGTEYRGVLLSDFYAAYNGRAPRQQRCWVHLLRDLHTLKEEHAADALVVGWAQAVQATYRTARAFLAGPAPPSATQRRGAYRQLVARVHQLGQCFARERTHPCWALAKRLLRHQAELFQFVLVPGLPADNNEAERAIRPQVIARKVSGGTRSPAGSAIRLGLASLTATWQARGYNPHAQWLALLSRA
jgi:transposase